MLLSLRQPLKLSDIVSYTTKGTHDVDLDTSRACASLFQRSRRSLTCECGPANSFEVFVADDVFEGGAFVERSRFDDFELIGEVNSLEFAAVLEVGPAIVLSFLLQTTRSREAQRANACW